MVHMEFSAMGMTELLKDIKAKLKAARVEKGKQKNELISEALGMVQSIYMLCDCVPNVTDEDENKPTMDFVF